MLADTQRGVEGARAGSRGLILRIVLGVIFVGALAWAAHAIDPAALAVTFRHVLWPLVAVLVLVQLVPLTLARALRWRALLPASPRIGLAALSFILLGGQALSNVLPLRAGDAYRAVAVHRRSVPVERVVAAQAAEKVVETASIATFAIPVVLTVSGLFRPGPRALIAAGIAALLVGAVAVLVVRAREGKSALARVVVNATKSLRNPRAWAASYAAALVADAIDIGMIALSARAVGVPLSFVGCATVLVAVNLAIAIPAAPAHIGTLEAGAVVALVALGATEERALACALVYHAVHVVPGTLVGSFVLAVRPRARATRQEVTP